MAAMAVARAGLGCAGSIAPIRARPGTPRALVCRARASKAKDVVIPDADYKLPGALLAIGAGSFAAHSYALAGTFGLLGVFLAIQASRVQFVFDKEALEVLVKGSAEETENAFVGGRNRWPYRSFVNWELWWPGFPVLVYFKETQTKPEGQIHFFPVIFNGEQLYQIMVERCGKSVNSLPK